MRIDNVEVCRYSNVQSIISSLGEKYINIGIRFKRNRWEVAVSRQCKNVYIGTFKTNKEAIDAKINFLCNEFSDNINRINCSVFDIYKTEFYGYFVTPQGNVINRFGNEVKGFIDKSGYHEVLLSINNKQKIVLAHRLVLKSICPIENFENLDVNHKDGNKQNNNIENLEWCTRSYNVLHSFEHRLQDNIAGIKTYTKEEKEFIKNNIDKPSKMIAQILNRNSKNYS